MVMPLVGQYERLALVGLEEESEEVFKEIFREAFPEMDFASRREVLEAYPEEDLYSGRVDRAVRDRLRDALGVQGVVSLFWEDSGMGGTVDWRMTITDTETGQTTGMAVARVRREALARGSTIQDLEKRAFEALVNVLKGKLNR
jgi:hypothetical protein